MRLLEVVERAKIVVEDGVDPRAQLRAYYADELRAPELVDNMDDGAMWSEILYLIGVDDWPYPGVDVESRRVEVRYVDIP